MPMLITTTTDSITNCRTSRATVLLPKLATRTATMIRASATSPKTRNDAQPALQEHGRHEPYGQGCGQYRDQPGELVKPVAGGSRGGEHPLLDERLEIGGAVHAELTPLQRGEDQSASPMCSRRWSGVQLRTHVVFACAGSASAIPILLRPAPDTKLGAGRRSTKARTGAADTQEAKRARRWTSGRLLVARRCRVPPARPFGQARGCVPTAVRAGPGRRVQVGGGE